MKYFLRVAGILSLAFAPFAAFAAGTAPANLQALIGIMTGVVTGFMPWALLLLVFYWNISQLIFNADNAEKRKTAIPRLIWSIVVLTIIFSLGGIVNVVSNSIFGTTYSNGAVQQSSSVPATLAPSAAPAPNTQNKSPFLAPTPATPNPGGVYNI